MRAVPLTLNTVVMAAHELCRPVRRAGDGTLVPMTLPERVARMYLDMQGEWNLRPLAGISTAPLLAPDGSIRDTNGYDEATELWCCRVPPLNLPDRPAHEDAVAALRALRDAFKTFPFADAVCRHDRELPIKVVDLDHPPGRDESAFLAATLTAICRPSLWLAPAFLVGAPQVSGAGTGKGLLISAICIIAFGSRPRTFTAGHDRQELDKRLASELVEAAQMIFLDNMNGAVLRSDTLASALTQRPARVRPLGQTRMVALNSTAFIAVTGNGVRLSEDLARRFVVCELDARCEDPETRKFAPGFLDNIERRRAELLSAALTIWQYGRQNVGVLQKGRPLGSFEPWCEWVRDPLLALGCRDPVERVEIVKAQDPYRQHIGELFRTWYQHHGETPVKAADLADPVLQLLNPQARPRQYVATRLGSLAGARSAGFVLTRQEAAGFWGVATYALRGTAPEALDGVGHRGHRTHGAPMPPMSPMPDGTGEHEGRPAEEETEWTV
jgi:hypothetical protein